MKDNKILDYYIRCAFCNEKQTIKEAVLDGWKLCNGCQLVFCKKCIREYKESGRCPGSVYTIEHKTMFSKLPIKELRSVARELTRREKEGKFISRLFFDRDVFRIDMTVPRKKDEVDDFKIIRFREEQWRKFGTVLVKRKDGKFISWGQIE
ncbi:MAG: hypothetical protein ACTSQE_03500 [Candidatus Heimdallarchaeaceae archaeon]